MCVQNARYVKSHGIGRQRCIGGLKSQVSFRKRAINYSALLREIQNKDKASYDSTDVREHGIGRRRCIGGLKSQVSFRKRAINYRALLREIPHKDKASCVVRVRQTWFWKELICLYGVATIRGLLKIIILFCKRASSKRWYSAKETY